MPFQDDRASSRSGLASAPGLNEPEALSGPLQAGENTTRPTPESQAPATGQLSSLVPTTTGQLTNINLARVWTATLPSVSENTTSQRIPVVIKGSMKKPAPVSSRQSVSHGKRRLFVTLFGVLMLVLVTGLALYSVAPLGRDIGANWNPLAQSGSNVIPNQNIGISNLVAQATATAVFHQQTDGYSGGGVQTIGNGVGSLNWPVGQCTYWANSRYHQLAGFWVPWSGNANQWVAGARGAGWTVSTSPHVPSIIVLMAGVQGASSYGHVAAVENIVAGASPVTVHTSNMNWYANGGGWDVVSYQDFTVGSGVYFVWHP